MLIGSCLYQTQKPQINPCNNSNNKLGQLVWTDLLPLKRISFSSTPPSFDSTVITLSRDIDHKFEKHTFAGKSRQFVLFSQTDIIQQANYFRFLLLSFSCLFSCGLSDWASHIASFLRFN